MHVGLRQWKGGAASADTSILICLLAITVISFFINVVNIVARLIFKQKEKAKKKNTKQGLSQTPRKQFESSLFRWKI